MDRSLLLLGKTPGGGNTMSSRGFVLIKEWHRYPPKMIPGIDIIVCTTATNDRDARLLLSAMGVPFYGEHRDS